MQKHPIGYVAHKTIQTRHTPLLSIILVIILKQKIPVDISQRGLLVYLRFIPMELNK